MENGPHLRWPPRHVTASPCIQEVVRQLDSHAGHSEGSLSGQREATHMST